MKDRLLIALIALVDRIRRGFSTPSLSRNRPSRRDLHQGRLRRRRGQEAARACWTLRGKNYPFTVSGMSIGFTIGASTTKLVGRAINPKGPASIEGSYAVAGAGGAIAAGAGGVQLQNANGVICSSAARRSAPKCRPLWAASRYA